ncbi:MAG: hypothetical protein ACLT0Z_00995 [Gemmiger sp.]
MGNFNGVALPVYDRNAPFATALNIAAGWTMSCLPGSECVCHDTSKDLKNLSEYAKQLRVHKGDRINGGAAQWLMLLHLYWHDLKTRRRKAEEVSALLQLFCQEEFRAFRKVEVRGKSGAQGWFIYLCPY